MRIFLSVDMEGVSGVTRWQDVITTGQDYQRARAWMTGDVNAAVAGARSIDPDVSVVVEENHGVEMLTNLLLDEIDPEVDVVRGLPRGGATTVAALTEDGGEPFDAMFLVGHHAKATDRLGIGAHTISYEEYRAVRVNGRAVGEGEIFATIAAQRGVPTALIAGDDIVCAEMAERCPGIVCAPVKRALSHTGGWIIPPVRAQRMIEDAARRAVEAVAAGALGMIELEERYDCEVELRQPITPEIQEVMAQHHPEFAVDGNRVEFSQTDMAVAYRMMAITSYLATKGRVRSY